MVKVSFNSALAQKDAAKKEEDEEGGQNEKNSCSNQVLILSPDTKVRRSPPHRRQQVLLPRASSRNGRFSRARSSSSSCQLRPKRAIEKGSAEFGRRTIWSSGGKKMGSKQAGTGAWRGVRSYIGPTEAPEVALSRLGLWRRVYFSWVFNVR